ncbi:MAG: SDR family NAD(P)-dependent oxidoreductase [Deltaproteobacteria bacterium]|jgi:acyl carrier protein|nr:SDR family NAD(P)-dependent oxidoreductase [Deltaproteobacteria bacterium]MDL1986231.1 SDR family NAD(P)-dependent oxidoreductase [Deltaproteobacteria bacterium]
MYLSTSTIAPVAVIGLGALFPKASDYSEYWNNIVSKKDCLETVPESRWRLDDYYDSDPSASDKFHCRRGGFIPDIWFDPVSYGLPPNSLEAIDAAQLMTLQVARDTLDNAGYPTGSPKCDHERTAVVLGVAGTTMKLMHSLVKRLDYPLIEELLTAAGIPKSRARMISSAYRTAYPEWRVNTFPGLLANVVAGRISNRLNLGGVNFAVDAACASSLCAVNLAITLLNSGQCDLVVTGGVDTDNSSAAFMSFAKTGIFSPSGQIRSFDKYADGTLISEGIGLFALKRLSDALRDNDRIYAQIRGFGTASDGGNKSIFAPNENGQIRALELAYTNSAIDPSSIGLIEAHSPGTRVGDIIEVSALRKVFEHGGAATKQIALGSVKAQIGHTKAAAGAAGMMKAVLALHHQIIPPTLNIETPNPELELDSSPFYLNTEPRPWVTAKGQPRRAGVNAFGFGGANHHTILEEAAAEANLPKRIFFTSKPAWLNQTSFQPPTEHKNTPYIPARSGGDCHDNIERDKAPMKTASPAVMFSGQGSQFIDMGRDLALYSPMFRTAINCLDEMFRQDGKAIISDVLFPPRAFSPEALKDQEAALKDTHYTHAALAVLEMTQFQYFRDAEVEPACVFGHSSGEMTALWAAGVFSDETFLRLIYARGKALSQIKGEEAGILLSIRLGFEDLKQHLSSFPGVETANLNDPEETVVGGSYEDISSLTSYLGEHSISCIRLKVAAAFHTSYVYFAKNDWEQAVKKASFSPPEIPVYSNTKAEQYANDPEAIRVQLAEHPFKPVRFMDQVRRIHSNGHDNFLEIGPRKILSRLVARILQDNTCKTVSCYPSANQACLPQMDEALQALGLNPPGRQVTPIEKRAETSPASIRLSAMGHLSQETRDGYQASIEKLKATQPLPASPSVAPANFSGYTQIHLAALETHKEFLLMQRAFMETLQQEKTDSDYRTSLRETMDEITRVHRDYIEGQIESMRGFHGHAGPNGKSVPAVSDQVLTVSDHVPDVEDSVERIHSSDNNYSDLRTVNQILPKDQSQALTQIISEKTGYPAEVIQPDMDLEADLGIDSIKRVEIFASVNEILDIHLDPSELTEFRSIGEVANYLTSRVNVISSETPADVVVESETTSSAAIPMAISEYIPLAPAPLISPCILGNTLIISDGGALAASVASAIEGNGCEVRIILKPGCDSSKFKNAQVMEGWSKELFEKSIESLHLDALGISTVLQIWEEPIAFDPVEHIPWLVILTGLIRPIFETGSHKSRPSFLIAASDAVGKAQLPLHSFAGAMVRTLSFEWAEIRVGSIIYRNGVDCMDLLKACSDPDAPLETFLSANKRETYKWVDHSVHGENTAYSPSDVFLVSGGARGITAKCVIELSKKISGGRFVLVGRTPLTELPKWISDDTVPDEIKKQIVAEMASSGNLPSPKDIESEYKRLSGLREIKQTLDTITDCGGQPFYCCSDIADSVTLNETVSPVLKEWGPVTGIIHGAGVLADNLVEKLTLDDYLQVYHSKVTGLSNLLAFATPDNLRLCVLFSSVAASIGNSGQSLYAISNQILNDRVESLRDEFPYAQVYSLNWGPWDAGMVTPLLKRRFLEMGIRTIPVNEGTRIFNTLVHTHDSKAGNLVIGDRVLSERKPLIRSLEKCLDAPEFDIANDHVIAGNAVLPAARAVTWMVDAAARYFPEPQWLEVVDLRVINGIFPGENAEPYTIILEDFKAQHDGYSCSAAVQSKNGAGISRIHYSCVLHFSETSGKPKRIPSSEIALSNVPKNWQDYRTGFIRYGESFHGVSDLIELSEKRVVTHIEPLSSGTLFKDRIFDLATHGILIWLDHYHETACLPCEMERYAQVAHIPTDQPLVVTLEIKKFHPPMVEFRFTIHSQDGNTIAEADGLKMTLTSQLENLPA